MSAANRAASPTVSPAPAVPAHARALAAQLAGLFGQDSEIVRRLNSAHRLLADANDRLWSDPAADRLVVHEHVHRAFCDYQQASEERRQLAVDVGELTQQLADALGTAGLDPRHAQSADVHELAAGTWQSPENDKEHDQ
jgi:hypothetical protein